MNDGQFNKLMTAIRGVTREVRDSQRALEARLDAMDKQITDVRTEIRIMRATSSTEPPRPSRPVAISNAELGFPVIPPGAAATYLHAPPSNMEPAREHIGEVNDVYLPWTLQAIAANLPSKKAGKKGNRVPQLCVCGKPKGLTDCFRDRHFDWCFTHSKHVAAGHHACEFAQDCKPIHWRKMSAQKWAECVARAKESGLGQKGVQNLERVLFSDYRH